MSRLINLNGEKPDYIPQDQWDSMKEKFDEIYEDKSKKFVIKMANAYGNTAVHSIVDSEEQAEAEVRRLKTSQERYDNDYWWEEQL